VVRSMKWPCKALMLSVALAASTLLMFWLTIPAQAQVSTMTVNTIKDENTPSDGKCSLREAIQNANDDAKTSPECAAGGGDDRIVFSKNVIGETINLDPALGQLTVMDAARLVVDGGKNGKGVTVSGGDQVQVFEVETGAKLAIRNLTVANGSAPLGGGIENEGGTLTVTDSTFSDNNAVGTGSAPVNCENACLGGGIHNDGGTLKVTRSTFSGNKSDAAGGGISNANGGTLNLVNSTFSENGAGFVGGAVNNAGKLDVIYSTFSDNVGDAINNANAAGVTLTLSNTILANSTGGNIREVCAGGTCQGKISDGGYNISDDDSTSEFFTDRTSKSDTEAGLAGGLANNGGPTQTIAIRTTGPAFDAISVGVNGCGDEVKTDQRGVARPQAKKCDVGAYEKKVRRR
jgi:CSLREA domain-containing protein